MDNILNIEEIPSKINFWLIRTKSGIFYDEFKNNNYVAIGWNNLDKRIIDSLAKSRINENKKTYESRRNIIINEIEEIWGVEKRVASQNLNKAERFINEVKNGDIVMIPSKSSTEITFAEIGEYFEKNISNVKELEIEKRIKSREFDYLDEECPYKKCRKIKIIKTLSGPKIHPKLYEALVSRHGISNINDYAEYILSSMYTLYCWNNKLSLAIRIDKNEKIDGFEFSKLMYNMSKVIRDTNEKISLTTRMNLNSPGILELIIGFGNNIADIMQNPYVIKAISIIAIGICGGKYGDKSINSILDSIMKWKKTNSELKDAELDREKKKKEIEREDIVAKQMELEIEKNQIAVDMEKEKLEQERIKTEMGKKMLQSVTMKEISEASENLGVNKNELEKITNIFEFMNEK